MCAIVKHFEISPKNDEECHTCDTLFRPLSVESASKVLYQHRLSLPLPSRAAVRGSISTPILEASLVRSTLRGVFALGTQKSTSSPRQRQPDISTIAIVQPIDHKPDSKTSKHKRRGGVRGKSTPPYKTLLQYRQYNGRRKKREV